MSRRAIAIVIHTGALGVAIAVAALVRVNAASMEVRASAGWLLDAPFYNAATPWRTKAPRDEGATYIDRVLLDRDSMIYRWPERVSSPIRVWIEPAGQIGFVDRVQEAFAAWSAIGLPLRFAFVDRARDAEIRVRWADHLSGETGNSVWRADSHGWLQSADILLATQFANGRAIDDRSLRALSLHEIGHVIGLSHSGDRGDLMAPLVRVPDLSRADRATARLIYTLPAGPLR